MKKIYSSLFIVALFIPQFLGAQHAQWLNSTPVNYNLNPEMPEQPACISGTHIYGARLVDFSLNFGIDIFGSMAVDCYDTSGTLLWTFPMGQKLIVKSITADVTGNVFISGAYMETLHLGGTDSLVNTGSGFTTNLFLLSLDASGSLRWKRNVTLSSADASNVSALAIDPQENCWYALEYFDSTSIKKLDVNGNDIQSFLIQGTRTMGSFSFDPNGNMFIAGSSGSITLNVNGFSVNVPETYMMFVSRINVAGTTSWIQLAHDQTFQSPQIVATANGDAYISGNLMDSTSFGNVAFHGPQWVYDIFLTKVDSSGNFSWGVEVPETPNIVGDFTRGKNNFMDVDAAGNVYLSGTARGSVDWGNGVISDAGSIPSNGISIISFDNNGIARWQLTAGATGFVTPYSVFTGDQDDCYFSSSAVGTVTFDSLTTNQGGNYAFVLGKINSELTTAIIVPSTEEELFVYPNPVKEKLAIGSLPTGQAGRQYAINSVSIYNALGTIEMDIEVPATNSLMSIEMDISKLPSGIYFLLAGNVRTKFIVQHD